MPHLLVLVPFGRAGGSYLLFFSEVFFYFRLRFVIKARVVVDQTELG